MEPSKISLSDLPEAWLLPDAPPLEIDVGCHRGKFLVEMAQIYPDRNFFGIERQFDRVERARKKIARLGLANAALMQGEGREALAALPVGCADHIHILFPDPWPKRRHHDRRMVQRDFPAICARLLKPGGWLRLVTDDPSYAAAMKEVAEAATDFRLSPTDDREYPLTEFQTKFLTDGRPVYRQILRRN